MPEGSSTKVMTKESTILQHRSGAVPSVNAKESSSTRESPPSSLGSTPISNSVNRVVSAPQASSNKSGSNKITRSSSNDNVNNISSSPQGNSRFGLNFLYGFGMRSHSLSSNERNGGTGGVGEMSNSPTISNLNGYSHDDFHPVPLPTNEEVAEESSEEEDDDNEEPVHPPRRNRQDTLFNDLGSSTEAINLEENIDKNSPMDKDGFYSVRLTPLIDHSSSASGLYFPPIIRKIKPDSTIPIGRYTEKNKAAAHAPQGSSASIVFKSKVVSRTHALFQCNSDGQWWLKDCKSSSGTFLNHIRLSPASQESTLMPLVDGDIIQLGMDYRGGTEEVYRCVKIRCEFNKSWQRKVNQFNLEIHKKLKSLHITDDTIIEENKDMTECVICLMKIEPCQALFISPCSHSWHYKCIRPIIIKSYPQFYCPNCRTMCDLETDLDEDD
ncbi:E3 ubiquitin-protein ligase DMA2 [Spathaspora sp. JA1]|nr:E3 ubiquitin-protein ligase DMA2 [Spathaspora sp. JA1]